MPARLVVVVLLWAPLVGLTAGSLMLAKLSDTIPDAPDLERLLPEQRSSVQTRTGWQLAGERPARRVRTGELSPLVISAFLAAEDADFFEHRAFNLKATVRAALANLRAGGAAQGASTITQQLAKRFLSSEKTLQRKFSELLMARRMEAHYTKGEILEAYLNGVYFGEQAWGIEQASRTYFGKSAERLEVGEAALLAGVLPSPSRYNPRVDPERARAERDQVLRRMATLGLLSQRRADAEIARAPVVVEPRAIEPRRLPWAASSARRALAGHFDDDGATGQAWSEGGYTVVVSHDPVAQARARTSLRDGIEALDRRQGWRGPLGRVHDQEAVDAALMGQSEEWSEHADFVLARVEQVEPGRADIVTAGGAAELRLEEARWAAPVDEERHYKRPAELDDLTEILEPGDLVAVRRVEERWELVQPPDFEGALVAVDSQTGRTLASVGGYDADRSVFHRAEQGCRQPGSVFKPVVYAEAIARGLTAATMLSDLPGSYATGRGTVWKPKNADRDFKGYVTLADALAWSRNIPTVHLMDHLGVESVVRRAKKLGIDSEIDTTSSASLGASCVRPAEMAAVYAAFQRRGRSVAVEAIDHIRDADGDILVDRGHFATTDWSTAARLERMASGPAGLDDETLEVGVSEQVAFIVTHLLRRVVTAGTAHELPDEWQVAGKTGTTNDFDAWFVGFDGKMTAVTWIGSDRNSRPIGRGEHGATVAMPVFEGFYSSYWESDDEDASSLGLDDPPERVDFATIDPHSGLRSQPGEPGVKLPFIVGTAPLEFAPTRGTRQAEQLDALSHEF
ncbi:MAG: penicillin-binding protein 1A [Persicimonas sp.]